MKTKPIAIIISVVLGILLIPLVVMRFTEEVNWTISDFIIAGIILLGFGIVIELIIRKAKQSKYKAVFIAIVLVLLFLIWMELAVGLFDLLISGS
ncbi:MAG: hypothetical protein HKO92_12340 [Flavobacteriaceae bacterium]|nr:hypothetical protein [Bacteroidia bacterium]NNK83904.1 hypothetical protein [Flavobacteriaceae bacterium]